jgi:hypothetical protein
MQIILQILVFVFPILCSLITDGSDVLEVIYTRVNGDIDDVPNDSQNDNR